MREIKFQLIYKGLPFSSTDNGFNWHKKVYSLDVLIENSILGICDVHDSCELVAKRQSTGLIDKNGVDIYEGDIIKSDFYGDSVDWDDIAVISYDDNQAKFVFNKGDGEQDAFIEGMEFGCFEVIGNIHQNKELLKCV